MWPTQRDLDWEGDPDRVGDPRREGDPDGKGDPEEEGDPTIINTRMKSQLGQHRNKNIPQAYVQDAELKTLPSKKTCSFKDN